MKIKAIVALGENNVIGNKGKLPWDTIHEDLRLFKKTTRGHPVIMGRKTWDSLGEKPLVGRTNIILSSKICSVSYGEIHVCSFNDALSEAKNAPGNDTCHIIGGAEIYSLFLRFTDEILLTRVLGEYYGDVFFPEFEYMFKKIDNKDTQVSCTGVQFSFEHWVKK